jgi:hydrogenase maturation protease
MTLMSGRLPAGGGKTLVIGYGNTLRSDDGVGQRVAVAVASWELPGLETIVVHQLSPELAEPLASAELVIFVDALPVESSTDVEVTALVAANSGVALAHASDPRALLSLTRAVYGQEPRAWLLTVPAVDFSLGEALSMTAETGAQEALRQIVALIDPDGVHQAAFLEHAKTLRDGM